MENQGECSVNPQFLVMSCRHYLCPEMYLKSHPGWKMELSLMQISKYNRYRHFTPTKEQQSSCFEGDIMQDWQMPVPFH